MNFEVVKLYYADPYIGWQTKQPKKKSPLYQESYFIKVDGQYFILGSCNDSYYVFENEE